MKQEEWYHYLDLQSQDERNEDYRALIEFGKTMGVNVRLELQRSAELKEPSKKLIEVLAA